MKKKRRSSKSKLHLARDPHKKAISNSIATVLIVLVVIVIMGVLVVVILPTIQEWVDEITRERIPLQIEVNKGYTVWNADTQMAKVQIFRGTAGTELSKIKVVFTVYGQSLDPSVIFPPEENQIITREFDLAGYEKPEKVELIPIIVIDGEEIELDRVALGDLKDGIFEATYVVDVGEDETKNNPGIYLDGLIVYYPLTNDLINYASWNSTTKSYDEAGEMFGNTSTDGRYLNLDGDGDYAAFPQDNLVYGEGDRTACIWARTNPWDDSAHAWVFSYGRPGGSRALFVGRKEADLMIGGFSASDTFKVDNVWIIDKWRNICVTYNGTYIEVYLNGQELALTPITKTWDTEQDYAYFGRNNANDQMWDGSISDFALYERKLSPAEIAELHEAQKNRYVEFQE